MFWKLWKQDISSLHDRDEVTSRETYCKWLGLFLEHLLTTFVHINFLFLFPSYYPNQFFSQRMQAFISDMCINSTDLATIIYYNIFVKICTNIVFILAFIFCFTISSYYLKYEIFFIWYSNFNAKLPSSTKLNKCKQQSCLLWQLWFMRSRHSFYEIWK